MRVLRSRGRSYDRYLLDEMFPDTGGTIDDAYDVSRRSVPKRLNLEDMPNILALERKWVFGEINDDWKGI